MMILQQLTEREAQILDEQDEGKFEKTEWFLIDGFQLMIARK